MIIPCRGHTVELQSCLSGLARQKTATPYEVIVVDSAHDAEVAGVVEEFPNVRLVRDRSGLLAGEARNLGVEQALGRVLAFIDADCIPEPGWLQAIADGLDENVRLLGGPVGDVLPWHPIAVVDNLLQFADFPEQRPDGKALYFPSCNLAVRRVDFEELGRFQHQDQIVGEDTSFCIAAKRRWPAGLQFKRTMTVKHKGRSTLRTLVRHQYDFGLARGALGLHLKPAYQRAGRWTVMIPFVILKRSSYISKRVLQYRPLWILRLVLLSPLILVGLGAWAIGFRKGARFDSRAPT